MNIHDERISDDLKILQDKFYFSLGVYFLLLGVRRIAKILRSNLLEGDCHD